MQDETRRPGPAEDLAGRVREARRRLAADGPPRVRSDGDFERVSLPLADGDVLRDLVLAENPSTVIEISALAVQRSSPAGTWPASFAASTCCATSRWSRRACHGRSAAGCPQSHGRPNPSAPLPQSSGPPLASPPGCWSPSARPGRAGPVRVSGNISASRPSTTATCCGIRRAGWCSRPRSTSCSASPAGCRKPRPRRSASTG